MELMPASGQSEESVITPGGPRRRDQVSTVRPGEAVRANQEGAEIVPNTDASKTSKSEDLVLTPGGFRHRSLVHPVEGGTGLRLSEDAGSIQKLDLESKAIHAEIPVEPKGEGPDPTGGWISYAGWENETGKPLTSFKTTWRVPPAPATVDPGATIFLFNGIQNHDQDHGILQPVLQWGKSHAGGGSYWSIGSWYVTASNHAFHSDLVPVDPGRILVGAMALKPQPNGTFEYRCAFEGVPQTELPVWGFGELKWCNATLEAYGIQSCGNYPNTPVTKFTAIEIRAGGLAPDLAWKVNNSVVTCGEHTVVLDNSSSGGEVDIYYRQAG